VQLLERLQRLLKVTQPLVGEPEVVNRLGAVRLHSDGLEKQLPGTQQLALGEEAVALVDQRASVVAVVPHCEVGVLVRGRQVALEEVKEAEVGGGARFEVLVLLLEGLEHLNGAGELLALEELHRLGDVHLARERSELAVAQRVDDPVVAGHPGLAVQAGGNQLGSAESVCLGLLLTLADFGLEEVHVPGGCLPVLAQLGLPASVLLFAVAAAAAVGLARC